MQMSRMHRFATAAAVCAVWFAVAAEQPALAYSEAQFKSVTSEQEVQVNAIRDQEINQLRIVMGRRFSESRHPDLLLRLAELYTEKYRFYFLKENEIHQKLLAEGQKPKNVDHKRSKEMLQSSTTVCNAILKSRVPFAKLDQVYYFLGYNAEETGNHREAERHFTILVNRYPKSTFAPEAFRNLGEYAFEKKQFAKAVAMYEKAASYTEVPSYPRTLYKLSWAYFKTRKRSEALDTLKKVVELSSAQEKFVGLRDEALGDLVMFFAEAGRGKEAKDYFARLSGGAELYVKSLARLASLYEKRGEYRPALNVNQSLLDEYAEKRPDLVYEILGRNVELYRKLGDAKGEEKALGRLVSFLSEHPGEVAKGGDDSDAAYLRTKSYIRGRATEIHKEAQKKKDKKLYSRAADLYGLYMKAFLAQPKDDKQEKELSEIRTYRADSLLASGREQEALPELDATLAGKGDTKLRKEAGTTLLNILIRRLDEQAKSGKTSDATEKQFLYTAGNFEKVFPQDPLVAELKYKRARLAAGKSGPDGLNEEARGALKELVAKYPSRPESVSAAHDLVADSLKRKDSAEAARLAREFAGNKALLAADTKGELQKYLKSVVLHEDFSTVQDIEKGSDFAKAAAEYERLGAAAKSDNEVAFKAFNNAAVNYERAGKPEEALRVYSLLMERSLGGSAPREELKRLAAQQLWKSKFAAAAKIYYKLVQIKTFSAEERMSFVRTGFYLNWGVGDLASAALLANQGLRELCHSGRSTAAVKPKKATVSPGGDGCNELSIELGKLMIEAGKQQEALNHLRSYLSADGRGARKAEAAMLVVQIYQALHDERKIGRYLEEASRAVKPGAKSDLVERNAAAHAAFLLVEPFFTRFHGTKLELPEDRLKKTTQRKLADLESLVTRYTGVVSYGDGEWGIAALQRLYDAFSEFASELDQAPVPSRLDAAKKEQYLKGLRQVSEPMRTRANDYLRQAFKKGIQLHVTSPTFVGLMQRLGRALPSEFPPAHYTMGGSNPGLSDVNDQQILGEVRNVAGSDLASAEHPWRQDVAERLAKNPKAPELWVELGNIESMLGRRILARLMYEQALALNAKDPMAIANLARLSTPIEGVQGFLKSLEIAETNKEIKMNLVRLLLAYHHFTTAYEHSRQLAARFPDDSSVAEANAIAALGSADLRTAGAGLEKLDAGDSKRFNLWYNWSVWALLAGDKGQRVDALARLRDDRRGLTPIEKNYIELAISVLGAAAKENR